MREHPVLAAGRRALVDIARANGLAPHVTSIVRSRATQERLHANYLAGRSRYPAAPPGRSKHELGLAFDMVVNDPRYYEPLGRLWESWGGRWGGRFRDEIHFELVT